ncbi:MAG: hypothetical protein HC824_08575 [Synechococcales cyanobacterium RM1_1_8]|nr:hypothetical protein [Synechococcales cyanobacterium RM1_1_8]
MSSQSGSSQSGSSQSGSSQAAPARRDAFQAGQIVRLAQDQARLYAEVIDSIASRDMVWARPLLLVDPWPEDEFAPAPAIEAIAAEAILDLREQSHLLWPTVLFKAVLDVEILPLLPYLYADKPATQADPGAAIALGQFMAQLWQQQWPGPDLAG